MERAKSRRHSVEVPRDKFGNHEWKYHIFLSFRGADTRFKFTDQLYHALYRAGINTFRDAEELQIGDEIGPALRSAIEDSRISIIVLSKNYASSSWCLDELVRILECRKLTKQVVLPVFYEVEPSEVRHQTGSFGDSMARHEKRFKENIEKVEKWRSALQKVANLAGECYTKEGSEAGFIDKIIQKISRNLADRSLLQLPEKVVGFESRKLQVISLLCFGKNDADVSMVGIYGPGGVGKTTIVKAVYNLIAEQFESTSFFADVRGNTTKHGLAHIQQSILTDLLGKFKFNLHNKDKGSVLIKERLQKKRVLLVLDNVDKLEQLQSLAGGCDWFGAGSRVIITTRDKQLLSRHGIKKTYEVEELDKEEALELLCWNAFKSSVPKRGYEDVSTRVLSYAKGIPLAVEIIGSHLFRKDIEEWESAMDAYEKSMDNDLFGILKVSYESLGSNEKQIFLDVACFLRGLPVKESKEVLGACGFSSKSGLRILEDKCLVRIQTGRVWMHDLTQSMGREIVRLESEGDPGKRSRIWFPDDALLILESDMGTRKIQALMLTFPQQKEVVWSGKALKKMVNLRLLIVYNAIFSQAPKALPNNLRVLMWENYPSSSLPSNFHGNRLLRLDFLNSPRIVKLQETFKKCQNITYLYIHNCNSLKEVPDVSTVPNLSTIQLYDCPNLVKIHDSVGSLGNLERLIIRNCSELKEFSAWNQFKSLLKLFVLGCGKLGIIPFGCMQPTLQFVCFHGDSLGFQSDGRSRLLQEAMDRQISGDYHVYELGIPRFFRYRSNKNSISFWIQKTLPDIHFSFALKVSTKFDNNLLLRLGIGPLKYLYETYTSFQYGTRMTRICLLPRFLAHDNYLEIQEMLIREDYWVRVDISMVLPESNDRNEDLHASVEDCGIYVSPTCDANFSFVDPYSWYSINNKSSVRSLAENGVISQAIVDKKDDLSSSDLLWTKIMSLEVSPQVKHFAWTAISDHLTRKQNLEENESCDRCHMCGERNVKMAFHFLKNCQWARGVWLLSPLGLRVDRMEANNLSEWMQKLDGILDTESFELFLVIAWGLWCEWDKLYKGLKIEDPPTLIRRMCVLLLDYRIAHRSMGQYMLTDADVAPRPSSQPAGCQDGDQPCQNKNRKRKRSMDKGKQVM